MKTYYSLQNTLDFDNPNEDGSYPIGFHLSVGNTSACIASGKSVQYKHWSRRRHAPKRSKKKLKITL